MARRSGLVARGNSLHRRDLQIRDQADFRQGRRARQLSGLFNSSLEGSTRRAIDIHEGEPIDGEALKALIRAAVALNTPRETAVAPPVRSHEGWIHD